ncbi:response regulator transcription factor [Niabella beijingensis]|uniref:response regulator transcription factor n=1 Tax=Niabella beijingensis TaxID=2872700 RepID=UPI001CBF6804|nr:response regulator transcription factor [Niabella beijingensis]MBZ4188528.1 response regulator transcription factor [Niabella beijingensis]
MKILIVEDNIALSASIRDYLEAEHFICECAFGVDEAREKLSVFTYDFILLDMMLPDGDGLEVLRFIKTEKIVSNVLIISARDALDDKINGLEGGADDYITKPFHLPELHARLRAMYRRNSLQGSHIVTANEIELNTNTIEARVNSVLLDITPKEFDLLLYFVVNKDRVLSRQAIATHLWGDYTDNLANFDFIYQHIKNLRKKIAAANGNDYIETVYGLGYRFKL